MCKQKEISLSNFKYCSPLGCHVAKIRIDVSAEPPA